MGDSWVIGFLIGLSALLAAVESRIRRARARKARLADAEAYFKKYGGHYFHMGREEPEKYTAYKALHIPPELEEQWRQEMIRDELERFFQKPELVWVLHGSVIKLLRETTTRLEKNCARLLTLMERMETLDVKQKTLIIEAMAGRSGTETDGGCYLICVRTSLGERMNAVMQRLIRSALNDPDRGEQEARLLRAVQAYESAYQRFQQQERYSV